MPEITKSWTPSTTTGAVSGAMMEGDGGSVSCADNWGASMQNSSPEKREDLTILPNCIFTGIFNLSFFLAAEWAKGFPLFYYDIKSYIIDSVSEIKRPTSRLHAVPEPTVKITKSDRTRAAILNAALEFIWSNPFRELTVNSLMASTDLSRSLFYQYFEDIHKVMETLLHMLAEEIFSSSNLWLEGVGDPVALMNETFEGLTRTCYRHGPFLRAVSDAATSDERFEKNWLQFLAAFDDAGIARIEGDQVQGLIAAFDARPVAFALNRLNAYTFIEAFGQRPRKPPKPIQEALARIWISTLYGAEWSAKGSSSLVRT